MGLCLGVRQQDEVHTIWTASVQGYSGDMDSLSYHPNGRRHMCLELDEDYSECPR